MGSGAQIVFNLWIQFTKYGRTSVYQYFVSFLQILSYVIKFPIHASPKKEFPDPCRLLFYEFYYNVTYVFGYVQLLRNF